jgi:AcrR family transcriptional regulator
MNPDTEQLHIKLQVAEKAAELYVRHNGAFTFNQIAKEIGVEVGDLFDYFPNKKAVLEFFYTSLVIRYRMMITEIEDFDTYTLSEKLSNFVYASFDMMDEHRAFVDQTFGRIIYRSNRKTEYESEVENLLKSFFEGDRLIATSSQMMSNNVFFALLRQRYLGLIRFWLNDTSEDRELTMELTDKSAAFLQEVAYSAVIDKGLDLLRFLISNNVLVPRFSLFDKIASKFEIR